jgi:uncharacterized protein (DUF1778 family)
MRSTNDQQQWYDRAAEMRTLAGIMSDVNTKRIMLRLADDYEALGDRAAKRAKGRRAWVTPSIRLIRPPSSNFAL